jgi:hypothetical protein
MDGNKPLLVVKMEWKLQTSTLHWHTANGVRETPNVPVFFSIMVILAIMIL